MSITGTAQGSFTVMQNNKQNYNMAGVSGPTDWQTIAAFLMTTIQTAAIAADAPSQAYLAANRSFITNNAGADKTLSYNGQTYTFTNGKTYCCSGGEADLFLNQAKLLGYSFAADTVTTYVAGSNGVVAFFAD